MSLLARQFLRIVLVAVAVSTSSLNAYASVLEAFDVHAHGGHGLHDHAAHAHAVDAEAHADHGAAGPAHSHEEPSPGDRACEHMHAHCCSTFAMPAAEFGLKPGLLTRPVVRRVVSDIPPGEGVSTLFRPPCATA
jgi:hypothetical protein